LRGKRGGGVLFVLMVRPELALTRVLYRPKEVSDFSRSQGLGLTVLTWRMTQGEIQEGGMRRILSVKAEGFGERGRWGGGGYIVNTLLIQACKCHFPQEK
jgi:hypothetical protein